MNICIPLPLIRSEQKPHQQHITDSAPCDGDQHLALPDMKAAGDQYGDQFRNAVTAMENADIFQAVDDQHAKDRRWQIFPKILDKIRCLAMLAEDHKWKKTCSHSAKDA